MDTPILTHVRANHPHFNPRGWESVCYFSLACDNGISRLQIYCVVTQSVYQINCCNTHGAMCHAHVCGIDFGPPRFDFTQGRSPRLCILNLWTDQRISRFQFNSDFAIRENWTVTFPYVSIWGIHPWLDSSTVELSLGGLTSGRSCRSSTSRLAAINFP